MRGRVRYPSEADAGGSSVSTIRFIHGVNQRICAAASGCVKHAVCVSVCVCVCVCREGVESEIKCVCMCVCMSKCE